MDPQPPINLPMHDEPPVPTAPQSMPAAVPVVPTPVQTMPSAPTSSADDMFSGVEKAEPAPPLPTPAPAPAASRPMASTAPTPVTPPLTGSLPGMMEEAHHPPVLHYVLIALAVVVVLGLIAGGVWFFAIRRPARQVMEALPAATTSSTDLSNGSNVVLPPVDEPAVSDLSNQPDLIPSKPVVTPPDGTSVPPPTSIDPNARPASSSSDGASPMASSTIDMSATDAGFGTTASAVTPPTADQDSDGLSDSRETELGTNPAVADTDGDGLSDGDEVLRYHTNPLNPDTDGDGFPDGVEVQKGYNPLGAGKCAQPSCVVAS